MEFPKSNASSDLSNFFLCIWTFILETKFIHGSRCNGFNGNRDGDLEHTECRKVRKVNSYSCNNRTIVIQRLYFLRIYKAIEKQEWISLI